MRRADLFIFYDDIHITTNMAGATAIRSKHIRKQWLTIPVNSKGSVTQGVPIKDVRIDWFKPWAKSHLKSLTISYSKSPHFKGYPSLLGDLYQRRDEFLADFTIETSIRLARELGFTTAKFMRSSELTNLEGQKPIA
ncbi:MAG: WbqC family protein [Anaerolineales bacterium]